MTALACPTVVRRLEDALARIRDPQVEGHKIFTRVYEQRARREAEESDSRVTAGQSRGPLEGRIISIKDLFDIAVKPRLQALWFSDASSAWRTPTPPSSKG